MSLNKHKNSKTNSKKLQKNSKNSKTQKNPKNKKKITFDLGKNFITVRKDESKIKLLNNQIFKLAFK